MEIRELRLDDGQSLAELVTSVYDELPESMNFIYRPTRGDLSGLLNKKIDSMRLKRLVDLVTVEDERVIADCEIVIDESGKGIVGIIVSKAHRRRGIGTLLLGECIKRSHEAGAKIIYAEVTRTNGPALAFFSKSGFEPHQALAGKPGKAVLARRL